MHDTSRKVLIDILHEKLILLEPPSVKDVFTIKAIEDICIVHNISTSFIKEFRYKWYIRPLNL